MAFFPTDIDEEYNQIMLECEVSNSIAKSDSENPPNPTRAFLQSIDTVAKVAQAIAIRTGNALDGTGMTFEVIFGIKIDSQGMVMIGKTVSESQITCRLSYRE